MEYRPKFPNNLDSFKLFISEHLFNIDKIDDTICASIIEKINNNRFDFTDKEVEIMKAISNIGPVCGCDDDHRIGEDKRICNYSCV